MRAGALCQGTAFSRAADAPKRIGLFAPDYGKTNPSCPPEPDPEPLAYVFRYHEDEYGAALLQSERNAKLLIDVLRFYVAAGKFELHDFVVMPDPVHLLIEVGGDTTIERAMQFIKGGDSPFD